MKPIVVTLAILTSCSGSDPSQHPPGAPPAEAPPEPPAPPPVDVADLPDVLLVSLDTTRADRLGAYGYDKALTETIDGLAARGVRYDRAYSPLPLTIPSHATLFTGLYPPEHGIRSNGDAVLDDDFLTLAERLKEAGYRTGASVAAYVTTRQFGFEQGFDVYYDDIDNIKKNYWHSERPADQVIDDMLRWASLHDDDRPRFAWVHLYDAHAPYIPWPDYIDKVEGRPYDAELARLDDQLQRLLDGFQRRPTLVVIVGDHGEALGDHDEVSHGLNVYDATQRVPFIIAGPGVPEGTVVSEPVSLADVSPTILDYLGLPPLEEVSGRSVREASSRPIYLESYQVAQRFSLAPPVAVVEDNLKLISLPRPELYDVVADPAEKQNLAEARADDVARLQKRLDTWAFPPPGEGAQPSAEVQAQLTALGYMEAGGAVDLSADLPDPKDHRPMLRKGQQVDAALRAGKPEEATKMVQELTRDYPKVAEFWNRLIRMRAQEGGDIEAVVQEALSHLPDDPTLQTVHASMLGAQGKHAEASEKFQELANANPGSPRLRVMAVVSLFRSDPEEGRGLAARYLVDHPEDHSVAGFVGVDLVDQGRFAEAMGYLERGILSATPEPNVAFHLAAAATGRGQLDEARHLLEREVSLYPGNLAAVISLGRMYLQLKDYDAAVDLTEDVLSRLERVPDLWHVRAQALYNLQRFDDAREAIDKGLEVSDPDRADLLLLDANLLRQEGKDDEALARFEEAKTAKAAEDAARREAEAKAREAAGADPSKAKRRVPARLTPGR